MAEKGELPPDNVSLPPNYAPSEAYTESPPPAYRKEPRSVVRMTRMICLTVLAAAFLIGFFIITHTWLNTRQCDCEKDSLSQNDEGLKNAGFIEIPLPKAEHLVDLNNNIIENDIMQKTNEDNDNVTEEEAQEELHIPDQPLEALEEEVANMEEVEEELEDERQRLEVSMQKQLEDLKKKVKIPVDLLLGNPALAGKDLQCDVEKRQHNLGGGLVTQAIIVTCRDEDDEESSQEESLIPIPGQRRISPPLSFLAPIMKMLTERASNRLDSSTSISQSMPRLVPISMPGPMNMPINGPINGPMNRPMPNIMIHPMSNPISGPIPVQVGPVLGPFPGPMIGPIKRPAPQFLSPFNGPLNFPRNSRIDLPINNPMNVPFGVPINQPLNNFLPGPVNGPLSVPINGRINGASTINPMFRPDNNPLNIIKNIPLQSSINEPRKFMISEPIPGNTRIRPIILSSQPDVLSEETESPRTLRVLPFPFRSLRLMSPRNSRFLNKPKPVPEERKDVRPVFPVFPLPRGVFPMARGMLPLSLTNRRDEPTTPRPLPEPTGRALNSPLSLPGVRFLPGRLVRFPQSSAVIKPRPPPLAEERVITHMEVRQPEPKFQTFQQPQEPQLQPNLKPPSINSFLPIGRDFGPPKVHTLIGNSNPRNLHLNEAVPHVHPHLHIHSHESHPRSPQPLGFRPKVSIPEFPLLPVAPQSHPDKPSLDMPVFPPQILNFPPPPPPQPSSQVPTFQHPQPSSDIPSFPQPPPPKFAKEGRTGTIREINPDAEIITSHQPPHSPLESTRKHLVVLN